MVGRPRTYKGRRVSKSPCRRWMQGVYEVRNKSKYIGHKPPYFRSSLEKKLMLLCDESACIKQWASEEPKVRYSNPLTGTMWNYHPDFLIKITDGENEWWEMIEVKPYKQTIPPKPSGRGRSRKLVESEQKTWAVNQSKWDAARKACGKRGWKFTIITENDLKKLPRIFKEFSERASQS